MYNLKPEFKSALGILIKFIILVGAGYFISVRLLESQDLKETVFYNMLKNLMIDNKLIFVLVLGLSFTNWLLEIFKWQTLVNTLQKISFKTAAKQCLSALTASLLTPNRLGDYVAKSLYFGKNKTKKIIVLNAVGHGLQLGVTMVFGILGLIYLPINYPIRLSPNIKVIILILALVVLALSLKIGRIWLKKLLDFYKNKRSKYFLKIGILSVGRYLIFSNQYYILLLLFGLQTNYFTSMMAIFSMYLLASILPSLSLTDWVIKGSVAVFIFGFLKVSALLVIQVSLLMWLLNFALPAIIGSFYVIKFKINPPKSVALNL